MTNRPPQSDSKFPRTPEDLVRLADFLDTRLQGPFGFRFGWDGIIGLIPGIGDLITASMSTYVIFRAAGLGAPPVVLLRMGANVLLENLFDIVPVVGNLFDFYWKANTRNLQLLERFLAEPRATTARSKMWAVTTVALILVAVVGMLVLIFLALAAVWELIRDQGGGI